MDLEKFGSALKKIMNRIASAVFVDKKTINSIADDLKKVLIQADVDLKLVDELTDKIKRLAAEEKIPGIERKEQLVKLIHDEIVEILGRKKYELFLEKKKNYRIMFIGLYGCGKTTTIAKLALYYSKLGYKVCMLGLDVHRPAAPEQLEQLAAKVGLPVFTDKESKNPEEIWKKYEKQIIKYDIVLIDTAGRDALDTALIKEIRTLDRLIKPQYTLLVMPSDIGQTARKQAVKFKESCDISGVVLTRMDGTAKAGGALAACYETKSPVLFIGTGEHIRDIEVFNPTAFVSRMLGFGDIESLLEKIKLATEQKTKRIEHKGFTLIDFYQQLKSMQSLGPLKKISELIPGMSGAKLPTDVLETQEEKLKKWKYAIDSMSSDEIENLELLEKETKRIARIAKGAGIKVADVRDLINQYKIIKQFSARQESVDIEKLQQQGLRGLHGFGLSQKQLRKLAKRFKGKINF
jgi:signal recognition particle subunit SRP54